MINNWWRDQSGSLYVSTALMMPILLLTGLTVADFNNVSIIKQRMQAAADAAVLAATQSQLLEKSGNKQQIVKDFIKTRLGDDFSIEFGEIDVDRAGFARVQIKAEIDTLAMGMVGRDKWELNVHAQAEYHQPRDIGISFLIDNSPSMLLGATQTDITQMEALHGCAFACHWATGGHSATYADAKSRGIGLRLDAAKNAVVRASDIAGESSFIDYASVEFDIYSFDRTLKKHGGGAPGENVKSKVLAIEPNPKQSKNPYEMTNPKPVFNSLGGKVRGAMAQNPDSERFVFIITDGVTNYRHGDRIIRAFDEDDCKQLKASGAIIGVIYTTYLPLPSNGFWRDNVDGIDDQVAPNLEACATPGWYYEAAFEEQIDAAVSALVQRSIPLPRLTQ